jgi:chromate reductase
MDKNKLKVLGLAAGSLRRGSYNKALLRSAVDLVPEDMQSEIIELEGIPPFNQDTEQNMPDKVKESKRK